MVVSDDLVMEVLLKEPHTPQRQVLMLVDHVDRGWCKVSDASNVSLWGARPAGSSSPP